MKIYKTDSLGNFNSEQINMFGECERVLQVMEGERVFSIYYDEDKSDFIIYEKCDEYFGVTLTSEICRNLLELFSKIANKVEAR